MGIIFLKEFRSYLHSLIAYLVISVFLIVTGLLFWVFPETSILNYGYADLTGFFTLAPYVFLFIIPAITMRSFSEERRSGTLEWLLTKPVTETQLVLAKFLAAFVLVCLALLPTITYSFSISALGNPAGNLDTPGIVGSYLGLILLGALFCSVGIFASVISRNSIVSFIIASVICIFLFIGFEFIATLPVVTNWALFIRQLGIQFHYEALGKGLIDSRNLVYFFSVGILFLAATQLILRSRLW